MRPINETLTSLREGIDQRSETIQKETSLKHPEWEAAKDYVDSLPANYVLLIKKNGLKGKESNSGKLTRNVFDLGSFQGLPIELYEYTKNDGSLYKAWYVVFNNRLNRVYQRDL